MRAFFCSRTQRPKSSLSGERAGSGPARPCQWLSLSWQLRHPHHWSSTPNQLAGPQPSGLYTRSVEGGLLASLSAGRRGRDTSSPPQLGHMKLSLDDAHAWQNVHSNEQIKASVESAGKSVSQHSQLGLSSSIVSSFARLAGRASTSGAGVTILRRRSANLVNPHTQAARVSLS